jgi:membrane fusion protein (multidrug efflux system)
MVVGPDGVAVSRPVKVGRAVNGQWVVLDGLKAGEQVMVDGFQKLRGKAPVKAVPWKPAGSAPAASTAGSAAASGPAVASAPASAASAK